jgi:hypothetical protein
MSGAQIANDVKAALREAGVATGNGPLVVTITPTRTETNPWDNFNTPPASVNVVAVVEEYRNIEIDGARIRSGDKKLLLEPGEIIPKTGDTVSIEGVAHRIEGVMPLAPAGVDLLYTVQARRV